MIRGSETDQLKGEPWGPRLWLSGAIVAVMAACLQSYGIRTWPMADDEVPTLVEMGIIAVDPQAFSVPPDQIGRLPKALPVWYAFQRAAFGLLPKSEVSFRLPSLICGVLTSMLAFVVAARWRGLWFGVALAIVMNASQPFVFLAQVDRFYSMPLLLMTATLVLMWAPGRDLVVVPVVAVLTVLTVLSHNITVPVFGLAFAASCGLWLFRRRRVSLLLRSGVSALVSALIYLIYLVPLVRGWNSTGNPTPVLISFTAHLGLPTLALAFLALCLCIVQRETHPAVWWSGLILIGSLCLFQVANISWSPRYFLFFMPAAWVLAAHAVDEVAGRLPTRPAALAWYAFVGLLLMPHLLSHYVDGSRHDYRAAASVVMEHAHGAAPVILSDDAETISYYLPQDLRRHLVVRTKVTRYPSSEFYLVTRANAWTPLPTFRERQVELLAELYHRRIDEFSHILRVYRIAPASGSAAF